MTGAPLPLAHPLTEPGGLPISPALAALYAAALVLAIAVLVPRGRAGRRDEAATLDPWTGRLNAARWATRAVGIISLLAAIVIARAGAESELENIVPALVLGVGWPLALLATALGASWRWIDPIDGIARIVDRQTITQAPDDVAYASLPAGVVAWYLAVPVTALAPRSLGTALAMYALIMVGGALYLGRSWLGRFEPIGLLFSWLSRLGRGRLVSWQPPRGVDLVLGVFGGGLLFGAIRRSALWGDLNTAAGAALYATIGFIFCAAAVAALITVSERSGARRGAEGSLTVAMIPAVASIGLALALARNRMFVSLQLLPSLASDPAGAGWDLFGTAGRAIDPNPLGTTGLAITQTVLLVAGHLVGAYLFARRSPMTARRSGAIALAVSVAAGLMAVLAVGALPPSGA